MKTTDSKAQMTRDGDLISPWQIAATADVRETVPPKQTVYDCLIVGGGITGLTAALRLQASGKSTLITEAHTIGFGTTGGTSAHINTFADTTYQEAESAFGEEGAQLFADAIREGLEQIRDNASRYQIACDLEDKPGYLYAENEEEIKQLEEIRESALKVGVAVKYVEEVPTPVPFLKALQFDGQAQFQPLLYLNGLRDAYLKAGGVIRAHTLVENVTTENGIHLIKAGALELQAKAVIYATHIPPNLNVFNFECAPYRSYVMAVKLKTSGYPEALIYDCQKPYHYVRSHTINGEQLLLVGGLDHKTGHEDPEKAFAGLEKYIRNYYPVSSIEFRWSSQYYVPVDGLPYIGQLPLAADGICCATGYNGNGMMLGSFAGILLSDLVSGTANKYAGLFSPSRIKPVAAFSEFVKENSDVAYHFVADRLAVQETDSLKRLQPGTGKVIKIDGKKIAAYRDGNGRISALSPICTHAACIVGWNNEEKTWDCPCHGARYDIAGKVLTGPATKGLAMIDLNNSDEQTIKT